MMTGLSTLKQGKKKSHVVPAFQLKPLLQLLICSAPAGGRGELGPPGLEVAAEHSAPGLGHPPHSLGQAQSQEPTLLHLRGARAGDPLQGVWGVSPVGAPCSAQPVFVCSAPPTSPGLGVCSVLLPSPHPRSSGRKPGGSRSTGHPERPTPRLPPSLPRI